jgi:hypothetical protein
MNGNPIYMLGGSGDPNYSIQSGAWNDGMYYKHWTAHKFFTNGSERLGIDSSGNIGIGGAPNGEAKFEVWVSGNHAIRGNATTNGYSGVEGFASGIYGYGVYGQSGSYNAGLGRADGYSFVGTGWLWNSTGGTFNGDLYANNFYHNSDSRLKKDIKPIAGLDLIAKMQGVTFNWKKDGTKSAGVIAQDIERIMPEAVTTKSDGFKAVSYDALIAPLIEAVKELKAANDNLRTTVAVQEDDIAILKAQMSRRE